MDMFLASCTANAVLEEMGSQNISTGSLAGPKAFKCPFLRPPLARAIARPPFRLPGEKKTSSRATTYWRLLASFAPGNGQIAIICKAREMYFLIPKRITATSGLIGETLLCQSTFSPPGRQVVYTESLKRWPWRAFPAKPWHSGHMQWHRCAIGN